MLFGINIYLRLLQHKKVLLLVLLSTFALSAPAQNKLFKKETNPFHLNPLLVIAFKRPIKLNPDLSDRFKMPTNQLMYWNSFYLTPEQREARYRKNYPTLGDQIVKNIVTNIIYGKPVEPAVVPKF